MNHWLMKSEPDTFGITDLARVKIEPWTGVRNYMARNHMRRMAVGDGVLFHHSSVDPPGVAGLARVVRVNVVDETQFDPASKYYDPKATREKPIWDCVEVEYVKTLPRFVEIGEMRSDPALADMLVLKRGMRLSVQPVAAAEYARIVELGESAAPRVVAKPLPTAKPAKKVKPKAKPATSRASRKPPPRSKAAGRSPRSARS